MGYSTVDVDEIEGAGRRRGGGTHEPRGPF